MEHVHPADKHKCALPGLGETLVNCAPALRNPIKMTADAGNLRTLGSGKFEEEKPTFPLSPGSGINKEITIGIWLDGLA